MALTRHGKNVAFRVLSSFRSSDESTDGADHRQDSRDDSLIEGLNGNFVANELGDEGGL